MNFGGAGLAFAVKDKGALSFTDRLSAGFSRVVEKVEGFLDRGKQFANGFADKQATKSVKDYDSAWGGFNRTTEGSNRMLDTLKQTLRSVNELLSVERVEAWMHALGGRQLQDARQALEGLTHSQLNLTTGFEAQQQQMAQDARRLGANMGFTGDQLRSFTSEVAGLAMSTNRGADAAATAVSNWRWYGTELQQIGFRSARDLLTLGDVTGANIGQLAEQGREMIRVYGMTGAQVSRVMGTVARMGQSMGNVGDALGQMPQIMQNLRQRAAIGTTTEQLTEMARQTASLGTALYNFGFAGQDATQVTTTLFESLTQARSHMGRLTMGLESDLHQTITSLAPGIGDVSELFRSMEQGPEQFVSSMAEMVARIRAQNPEADIGPILENLRGRMQDAFGEQTSGVLTTFFRTATAENLRSMQTMAGSIDDIRRTAREGFSTGRTLQESFDMARDAAIASFRAIGRGDASRIVRDMGAEFRVFNNALRETVREGGLLGQFAERLSAAHSIGALAFIPGTMRPIALLMGQLGGEIGPVIVGLHQMGFRLGMLLSPLTPILIGLGLLAMRFVDLRLHGRSTAQALNQMADEVAGLFERLPHAIDSFFNTAGGAIDGLIEAVRSVDWKAVGTRILTALEASWEKLKPRLQRFASRVMERIGKALLDGSSRLGAVDWRALWQQFTAKAEQALAFVWPYLRDLGVGFFRGLAGALSGARSDSESARFGYAIGEFMRSSVQSAWRLVTTVLAPALRDLAMGVYHQLAGQPVGPEAAEQLGSKIAGTVRDGLQWAYAQGRQIVTDWWARMRTVWSDSSRPFTERLWESFTQSGPMMLLVGGLLVAAHAFGVLWPAINLVARSLGLLWRGVSLIRSAMQLLSTAWEVVFGQGILSSVVSWVGRLVTGLFSLKGLLIGTAVAVAALTVGFLVWPEQTARLVDRVREFLRNAASHVGEWVTTAIVAAVGVIAVVLPPLLVRAGRQLEAWMAEVPGLIARYLPVVVAALTRALHAVVDIGGDIIAGLFNGIERTLVRFFPNAAGQIHEVFGALRTVGSVVLQLLHGLVDQVGPLVSGTVHLIAGLVRGTFGFVSETLQGTWQGLVTVLRGAWTFVTELFGSVGETIGTVAGAIYRQVEIVGAFLQRFVGGIRLLFSDPVRGLQEMNGALWGLLRDTWENYAGALATVVRNVIRFVRAPVDFLVALAEGTQQTFAGLFNGASRYVAEVILGALRALAGLFAGALAAARAHFALIGQGFTELWRGVTTVATAAVAWIVGQIASFYTAATGAVEGVRAWFASAFASAETSVTNFALGAVARVASFVTSALAGVDQIRAWIGQKFAEAQTAVAERFAGIVTTIQTSIETAIGHVTNFKQRFLDALDGVWNRVMGLFGNSVHDVVGDDLAQTNQISSQWSSTFQNHATQAFDSVANRQGDVTAVANQFRTALSQGLTDALVGAFTQGYTRILAFTRAFTRSMDDAMTALGRAIFQKFSLLWTALGDIAAQAVAAIEQRTVEAARALARLQVQSAQTEVQAVAAPTQVANRRAITALGRGLRNGEATQTDLYGAIHEPDWYALDYRNRFDQRMGELKEAVLSLRPAQTPRTPTTPAQAQALQTIQRANQVFGGST